jgi:hypothetical protein
VALGGSRKKVENFLRMSEELCSGFSAEIEERGYSGVRHSMERRVSKKLRPLKTEVESGLEAELADPVVGAGASAYAVSQHASPPLVSISARRQGFAAGRLVSISAPA